MRTKEETEPIIKEMGAMFAKLRDNIKALPLKSDEVKSIRDKLAEGTDGMNSGITKILALGPNNQDMQEQVEVQKKLQQAQNKIVEAQTEFDIQAKAKNFTTAPF